MIDMESLNSEIRKSKKNNFIKIFLISILISSILLIVLLFSLKIITLKGYTNNNNKVDYSVNNIKKDNFKEEKENNQKNSQNIEVLKGEITIKTKEKIKKNKCNKKFKLKEEKLKVELHKKNDNYIKVIVDNKEEKNEERKQLIIKEFIKQVIDDGKKKIEAENILNNIKNNINNEALKQQSNDEIANSNLSYDKLVEKLASSVVHIKGIYLTDADDMHRYQLLHALDGEIFPAKKIKKQATCSGFFVSEDGYIATNHHCIDDAKDIDVETKNGNKYTAKIVGYFEGADIAILKIKPNKGEKFNAVKLANSDNLLVGDNIIIIGGPLGYKWSASAGIVSGKARDIGEFNVDDGTKKHAWGTAGEYIQVDAAINGGNSGGPAFNTNGEVVGIAAAGYTFLQGMKFIISSNTLSKNLNQLKQGKIIQKGLWGVNLNELEPYDIKAIGLDKNSGMLIHNVVKGSPAEKAGLKRGDVILKVNGKEIKDKIAMKDINSEIFDGSISKLEVNRYGKIKTFKIKAISIKEIEKLEKGEIGIQDWSDGNISYRLLTSKMHNKLRFPQDVNGIIITDIKDNNDPMLVLAVGDVIIGVNDKKITSIEEYQEVLKKLRKNKKDMAIFHIYKPISRTIVVLGSKIC